MRFTLIEGSPRPRSNTAALCEPFAAQLLADGAQLETFRLAEMHVAPCCGCYRCQQTSGEYGCVQRDDMYSIVNSVIASDIVVLATPVYTWYCTAEMKAVLDRFYGMNKYYGAGSGSLWAGKGLALIATHGYDADYGAGTLLVGLQRLCEHSHLNWLGAYTVRDTDDMASFVTASAQNGARQFARKLLCSTPYQLADRG